MKNKKRGLAGMSPEKRRLVQSLGGKASPTNFKNMDKKKLKEVRSRRWG